MVNHGPLCKKIKNDNENISKSTMWKSETVNVEWCVSKVSWYIYSVYILIYEDPFYSETCLKRPLKSEHQNLDFITDYHLMQVKSIAECCKGSILQYFRPPLRYHFPVRPWFCISLSGRIRQNLIYLERFEIIICSSEIYKW